MYYGPGVPPLEEVPVVEEDFDPELDAEEDEIAESADDEEEDDEVLPE